jgi:hypothetical protein
MRLINTATLELKSLIGQDLPQYAVLSHTWSGEEILFEDVKAGPVNIPRAKAGFPKMRDSCARAQSDGYEYIWIDTCCIDKSSSAELSEAINSMFEWYERSAVCYAYLDDYASEYIDETLLYHCRWFTRGWTLQELIAPRKVEFFNRYWVHLGSRINLATVLSSITGIDTAILGKNRSKGCWVCRTMNSNCARCNLSCGIHRDLSSTSIAARMTWASQRQVTREEDIAYCLMGLFDVNMPLLYGEGGIKAFRRLQEEIIKKSTDQSIFAFVAKQGQGAFASYPRQFQGLCDIAEYKDEQQDAVTLTAQGIHLKVFICQCDVEWREESGETNSPWYSGIPLDLGALHEQGILTWLALLNCSFKHDLSARPGILLGQVDSARNAYTRHSTPVFQIQAQNLDGDGQISVNVVSDLDETFRGKLPEGLEGRGTNFKDTLKIC